MSSDGKLNEREELILHAIVHTFITTAEAVGSRSIVKRYTLELSPATVRNVMSDLEELGYLEQLHTSSGRVPTDQGYRYYVDYLMRVQALTLGERARIEEELSDRLTDTDEVMRQTSQLLALISHQTGVVEVPEESKAQIRNVDLMPVGDNRVAVLVADSYGRVRTLLLSLAEPMSRGELEQLSHFLNSHFRGVAVDQLRSSLQTRMRSFLDEQRIHAERALAILSLVPLERHGQLFLEGATQLLDQPEFRDMDRARQVFTILEDREDLIALLRECSLRGSGSDGSSVLIGSESQREGMREISVVTAPFSVGDSRVGMLGVLGPRRMPYSKLTSVVEYTAGMLSRLLTRLAG